MPSPSSSSNPARGRKSNCQTAHKRSRRTERRHGIEPCFPATLLTQTLNAHEAQSWSWFLRTSGGGWHSRSRSRIISLRHRKDDLLPIWEVKTVVRWLSSQRRVKHLIMLGALTMSFSSPSFFGREPPTTENLLPMVHKVQQISNVLGAPWVFHDNVDVRARRWFAMPNGIRPAARKSRHCSVKGCY